MAKKYSDALSELMGSLQRDPYTVKTEEEIKAEAERKTASYYDQQELSTRQAYETNDQALARQLDSLSRSYDTQRESTSKEFASAYSQADRSMLSRGMQRSSYNAQTLANIGTLAAKAQQEIYADESATREDMEAQRTTLASQLGQQLKQLSDAEANDVLAAIDELEAQDYERGASARESNNSLSAMIYEYMMQEDSSGGSGGGSGGGGSAEPDDTAGGNPLKYPSYDDLLAGLNGIAGEDRDLGLWAGVDSPRVFEGESERYTKDAGLWDMLNNRDEGVPLPVGTTREKKGALKRITK